MQRVITPAQFTYPHSTRVQHVGESVFTFLSIAGAFPLLLVAKYSLVPLKLELYRGTYHVLFPFRLGVISGLGLLLGE